MPDDVALLNVEAQSGQVVIGQRLEWVNVELAKELASPINVLKFATEIIDGLVR